MYTTVSKPVPWVVMNTSRAVARGREHQPVHRLGRRAAAARAGIRRGTGGGPRVPTARQHDRNRAGVALRVARRHRDAGGSLWDEAAGARDAATLAVAGGA